MLLNVLKHPIEIALSECRNAGFTPLYNCQLFRVRHISQYICQIATFYSYIVECMRGGFILFSHIVFFRLGPVPTRIVDSIFRPLPYRFGPRYRKILALSVL